MSGGIVLDWPEVERIKDEHNVLTDAEMARKLGISHAHYSNIKHGKRGVSLQVVLGFFDSFGVPFGFYQGSIYKRVPERPRYNR